MNPSTVAQEVVQSLINDGGSLAMPEDAMVRFGKRVHELPEGERAGFATALIALATRIKAMPGSRKATSQVVALAAIALGDVTLNGALCRALYRPSAPHATR